MAYRSAVCPSSSEESGPAGSGTVFGALQSAVPAEVPQSDAAFRESFLWLGCPQSEPRNALQLTGYLNGQRYPKGDPSASTSFHSL